MIINVVGKGVEVTDAIRSYAEGKVGRLPKYFERVQQITVTLMKQNHQSHGGFEVELVLDVERHADFVSRAASDDLYAAIDLVTEKGERQLRDHKEIKRDRKHH